MNELEEAALRDEIFIEEQEKMQKFIDSLTAERDEYKNKYLYALADYDNLRKRSVAEKPALVESGEKKVLKEILSLVDDFQRAVESNDSVEDVNMLRETFKMMYYKFLKTLSSFDVKEIETTGKVFDESVANAIAVVPVSNDEQDNVVIETWKSGYTYKDSLLRHAEVAVGKKSE